MDIYLLRNEVKLGPYSEAKVRDLLDSGLVTNEDMGWREGLVDWIPIGLIPNVPPNPQLPLPNLSVSRNIFRGIVILSFLFFIVGLSITWTTPSAVERDGSKTPEWLMAGESLLLAAWVVSYFGLMFVKKWARTSFTLTTVLVLVLSALTPSEMTTPWEDLLSQLTEMSVGAILTLSYFTSLFATQSKPAITG